MAINKVIYSGSTLIDLTDTTATASDVASGKKFHLADGTTATGTASGGGGMNVQGYHGYATINKTSYSASGVSLTVAKSGTYKVSWFCYRNRNSGTFGSQLYIGGKAYGSANTTWVNTYGQSVVLNNVALTAGQTVEVYGRSGNTSYVIGIGNLIIEQTA